MNAASAACSTFGACQSVRYRAFTSAGTSDGGATRNPSRNAGESTFENEPTYTTRPRESKLCNGSSGRPV